MKHIIIAGSARSGKTTLAAMLKEKYPAYSVFHGDAIREWLIALLGKQRTSELVHSDEYAESMLLLVNSILDNAACPYIIEWSRLFPSVVRKLNSFDQCAFIFLGHGGIAPKALMEQCRNFEDTEDFTAQLSDDSLYASCIRWTTADKKIMKECADLGYIYYNTTRDRIVTLQKIVDSVMV